MAHPRQTRGHPLSKQIGLPLKMSLLFFRRTAGSGAEKGLEPKLSDTVAPFLELFIIIAGHLDANGRIKSVCCRVNLGAHDRNIGWTEEGQMRVLKAFLFAR